MQKRLLLIGLALILGGVAVFLIKVYLNQQQQVLQAQARQELAREQELQASVVVANRDIPKAAVIELEMLGVQTIPKEYLQPQAVISPDRIEGMVALVSISKGEQVTLSKLTSSKQAGTISLAMATPVGKRAITISVDNVASLVGMIKPGDYVDVIAMLAVPVQTPEGKTAAQVMAIPLFQNALILAVGQEIGTLITPESRYKKEEKKEISSLITLALTPAEANLITFAQEQGKFRLVLRSPADSQIEPIQPASWETLFQYLFPQMPMQEAQLAKEKPKVREVEIYRGLKRETIPLSE